MIGFESIYLFRIRKLAEKANGTRSQKCAIRALLRRGSQDKKMNW
jgi:hypothetical protein